METLWTSLLLVALPSVSWAQGGGPPPSIEKSPGKPASLVVSPGEKHTNGDGVTVKNNPTSEGGKGTAKISPMGGGPATATSVSTKEEFSGTISGLDQNDSAAIGANSTAIVSGAGGSVSLGGNSTVSVTNNAPPGGVSTTVGLPGGMSVTLSPGSTATFDT